MKTVKANVENTNKLFEIILIDVHWDKWCKIILLSCTQEDVSLENQTNWLSWQISDCMVFFLNNK